MRKQIPKDITIEEFRNILIKEINIFVEKELKLQKDHPEYYTYKGLIKATNWFEDWLEHFATQDFKT